jgi:hypothetical protein
MKRIGRRLEPARTCWPTRRAWTLMLMQLQLDGLASDAPEPSEAGSGPQRVAAADALSPTRLTR